MRFVQTTNAVTWTPRPRSAPPQGQRTRLQRGFDTIVESVANFALNEDGADSNDMNLMEQGVPEENENEEAGSELEMEEQKRKTMNLTKPLLS